MAGELLDFRRFEAFLVSKIDEQYKCSVFIKRNTKCVVYNLLNSSVLLL